MKKATERELAIFDEMKTGCDWRNVGGCAHGENVRDDSNYAKAECSLLTCPHTKHIFNE